MLLSNISREQTALPQRKHLIRYRIQQSPTQRHRHQTTFYFIKTAKEWNQLADPNKYVTHLDATSSVIRT